jgi:hypothetical protein
VIVRGEIRVQTTVKGSEMTQRYGPTDRGDFDALMTMMSKSQGMPSGEES